MIVSLLVAAAVSTAPAPATPAATSAHVLVAGASHAVRANRLDQATVMISRAIAAGASGPELDRLLADFAYASGKYPDALARYEALAKAVPSDPSLFEPAGISALKLGQVERASSLLSLATAQRRATWRSWNAAGVVADLKRDWAKADDNYDHASRLAPREAAPINNRGWSLVLRGDWKRALGFFEQAIALDPKSERAADNLELAKAALTANLPSRQVGESDSSWAARLNDAGVAAAILGDKGRASAAFTQALNVSGSWYTRAANNLEALGSR
jgi:Flp pilus assembly protein TadD